jgi:hypothetical protein
VEKSENISLGRNVILKHTNHQAEIGIVPKKNLVFNAVERIEVASGRLASSDIPLFDMDKKGS